MRKFKINIRYFTILISFVFTHACFNTLKSQVTIGLDEKPVVGALLQLKDIRNSSEANATKGLGLPRVALEAFKKLEPCAESTSENQKNHTGLIVYNTTNGGVFKPGLYVWNGSSWQRLSEALGEQDFGPWYKVGNSTAASLNTDDSYLNAKVVIGGSTILNDSKLSVHGTSSLQGNVGVNTAPKGNTSLILGGTGKGLIPNKVVLTSVSDNVTIPVSIEDKGMTVYHIGGSGLDEGVYSWNGTSWIEAISTIPDPIPITVKTHNLLTTVTSVGHIASGGINKGLHLDFGVRNSDGKCYIIIPEDGSYAFSLRLYGVIDTGTVLSNVVNKSYYINMWSKVSSNLASEGSFIDDSEMGIRYGGRGIGGNEVVTYSVTLNGNFTKDELVYFRMCYYGVDTPSIAWIVRGNVEGAVSPARSSLIWWKL